MRTDALDIVATDDERLKHADSSKDWLLDRS
jgi:hypothetical protein